MEYMTYIGIAENRAKTEEREGTRTGVQSALEDSVASTSPSPRTQAIKVYTELVINGGEVDKNISREEVINAVKYLEKTGRYTLALDLTERIDKPEVGDRELKSNICFKAMEVYKKKGAVEAAYEMALKLEEIARDARNGKSVLEAKYCMKKATSALKGFPEANGLRKELTDIYINFYPGV